MELKEGYKQTEIGVIPVDWDVSTISDVADIRTGKKNTDDRIVNGSYPFFVRSQQVERVNSYAYDGEAVLTAGDGVGVGKVFHYFNGKFDYHQRVYKISEFKGVDGRFFFEYFRQNFLNETIKYTAKSSVDSVRMDMIAKMAIPLPPLPEQQAIAVALSDIDAQIATLDALITKKRNLKQATMQQLLTGKKRLPGFSDEWEIKPASEICIKIQDGTHFSPPLGGRDYLYVTSKNIGFGFLDVSNADLIAAEYHRAIYNRADVRKGDLLLTKDGANTGNAALNTLDEEISILSSVAFLRFDPKKHVADYYLQQILSHSGQNQIKELMSGNAITRLTLAKIKNLLFPVAPLAEQRAIADVLSDMDSEIERLEQRRAKTQLLKQGMMQELLTGKTRLL